MWKLYSQWTVTCVSAKGNLICWLSRVKRKWKCLNFTSSLSGRAYWMSVVNTWGTILIADGMYQGESWGVLVVGELANTSKVDPGGWGAMTLEYNLKVVQFIAPFEVVVLVTGSSYFWPSTVLCNVVPRDTDVVVLTPAFLSSCTTLNFQAPKLLWILAFGVLVAFARGVTKIKQFDAFRQQLWEHVIY